MNIRLTLLVCMAALLLCEPAVNAFEYDEESQVSKNWGSAYHGAKKAQIANPDAGAVTGPVEGFDGRAAKNAMDVYVDSFKQQDIQQRQGYSLDSISVISGGGM